MAGRNGSAPIIALVASLARLTAEQVAWVLNCQAHGVPVLVGARLLKPLGNPAPIVRELAEWLIESFDAVPEEESFRIILAWSRSVRIQQGHIFKIWGHKEQIRMAAACATYQDFAKVAGDSRDSHLSPETPSHLARDHPSQEGRGASDGDPSPSSFVRAGFRDSRISNGACCTGESLDRFRWGSRSPRWSRRKERVPKGPPGTGTRASRGFSWPHH